jgi:hypothetical protein
MKNNKKQFHEKQQKQHIKSRVFCAAKKYLKKGVSIANLSINLNQMIVLTLYME